VLKRSLCIGLLLGSLASFGQHTRYVHPSSIEVFFSFSDFRNNVPFSSFSKGYGGLGVGFIRGIGKRLDWRMAVNFLYADSVRKTTAKLPSKELMMSVEASVRWRLLQPSGTFQPFIGSGPGITLIRSYLGIYLQAGTGMQINISEEVSGIVRIQRRFGLNNNIAHHNFYSIGLAGNIGRRTRKIARADITVPVLPAIADRDKDSTPDSTDICPDVPGIKEFGGCPDTDMDGIPDNTDKCPVVPGIARFDGCPVPDTDKDGINDDDDQCLTVPGVARYKGCPVPDTDSDGVNDEEDSCRNEPGLKAFNGCPSPKVEIRSVLDKAARNIFFETGSYQLLPASFPALDTVITILKMYPMQKLTVEGHTDNVGKAADNKILSQQRANAIVAYLVARGIGQDRLISIGYGEEKPLASNKSAAGRAVNRRVQLVLTEN